MLTTIDQFIPHSALAIPHSVVPADFADNDSLAAWLNTLPTDISGDTWGDGRRWPWAGDLWGDGSHLLLWCAQPQDAAHVASLAGYWFAGAAAMGGEWGVDHDLARWAADSGRLFLFWCDTPKSPRDDFGDALEVLPALLRDGSPVRKTNRMGPGTAGTRAVAGLRGRVLVAWR